MKREFRYGLAAFAALMLGACAGPGAFTKIRVSMPNGERATIVAHDQQVPNWALATDTLALNYAVRGDVSAKQLAAVAETERACREFTTAVRPHALAAIGTNGILYALTGGVGLGLAANAFPPAKPHEYVNYGAAAGALTGTANGIVNLGGKVYTFENCGSGVLSLFPAYDVRIIRK